MTFFKKKITAEKMTTGLYHATISNTVKDDLKDSDGNVILTKKEQSLILTQHIYNLFERQGFKKSKLLLLTTYVANNHKVKTDNDLHFEMAISLDAIEKIRKFFEELSPESHKFFKQKFLFDKDLDPIQKTFAMQWYVSHCKIIDSAFELGMKKFRVTDEENEKNHMLRKNLRHRKYKKTIKGNSSFILTEFAKIVGETIEHFEKEGQIKTPEQKEVLKFEATALVFWLFRGNTMFEKTWHKLLLDEIHHQYYEHLRKRGYAFELRKKVNDDFNVRYRTYGETFGEDNDFARVGAKFVRFLSERSNTEIDIKDMMIPLHLTKKLTPMFEEWRNVMKN